MDLIFGDIIIEIIVSVISISLCPPKLVPRTDFGKKVAKTFVPKLVRGDQFWGDRFWCDRTIDIDSY